ncbi:unknown [Prevotella sp. CAG:1185]|nr:unknown [Prevotella sp. CAG:1185]
MIYSIFKRSKTQKKQNIFPFHVKNYYICTLKRKVKN